MEVWGRRAVAGTFSLIRFGQLRVVRVDCDFLAMIIGLSRIGLSFIGHLSTLSTRVWLVLENKQSKADNQQRRHLTITVTKQDAVAEQISQLLDQSCSN